MRKLFVVTITTLLSISILTISPTEKSGKKDVGFLVYAENEEQNLDNLEPIDDELQFENIDGQITKIDTETKEETLEVDEEEVDIVKASPSISEWVDIDGYTLPSGIVSIKTLSLDVDNKVYPWSISASESGVITSGGATVSNLRSIIKITVNGPGALIFDLRVYSDEGTDGDALFISGVNEYDYQSKPSTAEYEQRYTGEIAWQKCTVAIDSEGTKDIYIAYLKGGKGSHSIDNASIKDIKFNDGKTTITALSSNSNFGAVSGGGEYEAGSEVTLTATPINGGVFYGWQENGKLLSEKSTTTKIDAGDDRQLTAIFGDPDKVIIQNVITGNIYENINTALNEAITDDVLMLIKNITLTSNATIPSGVTLYIPYSNEYDSDGNADGTSSDSPSSFADESKTYTKLTINNGVTLTVGGELLIGGTISYPTQAYQGHTSGAHGRVTNNGTILVSGKLDTYGFIDGTGEVTTNGGKVYEPFIVFDFSGGNNTVSLYNANQSAFTEYTMQNIQCKLTINYGSELIGHCNLYASGDYNKANTYIVSNVNSSDSSLIKLEDGAFYQRTTDKTKSIPGGAANEGTYGADIYRTNCVINGGSILGSLSMPIYGVSISVLKFPIPYCYKYELKNGEYTLNDGWNIMPGSELIIDEDANLLVNGSLYALDGLLTKGMSGRYYPSSDYLKNNNFATNGVFIVNGCVTFKKNSVFGGIIQTTSNTAKVITNIGCELERESVQFGATGYYDDNTCVVPLNARLLIGDNLVTMQQGKMYSAASGDAWQLDSYTVLDYAKQLVNGIPSSGRCEAIPSSKNKDGVYETYAEHDGPVTITTNQSMNGKFSEPEDTAGNEITVINKTYYSEADNIRTEVIDLTVLNNAVTFKVNKTNNGTKYNYMVQYQKGDSIVTTLYPNTNGVYTINNVEGNEVIIVTSIKKGDVDLDGDITAADVTKLRRSLAGYESLGTNNKIGADYDFDTNVTAADVTLLRRFLAGYTS